VTGAELLLVHMLRSNPEAAFHLVRPRDVLSGETSRDTLEPSQLAEQPSHVVVFQAFPRCAFEKTESLVSKAPRVVRPLREGLLLQSGRAEIRIDEVLDAPPPASTG
jgi:hypothetical protein